MESTAANNTVTLRGRVEEGSRIGRTIGFPTANIAVEESPLPDGVYVAEATIAGEEPPQRHPAVADLGVRPSVPGDSCRRLETHLLDFSGDLYGRDIEVRLLHCLRPERRFGSVEELRRNIALDMAAARRWFARRDARNEQ